MTGQPANKGIDEPALQRRGSALLLWLTVLTTVLPYVVVTVFVTGAGQQVVGLLPTFLFSVLLALVTGMVGIRTENLRAVIAVGVLGLLIYEVSVFLGAGRTGSAFAYPIFEIIVLYRQIRVLKTSSLSDENRTSLAWETAGIVLAAFILLVNPLERGVIDWFTGLLLLGLILRLTAMWQVERLTTDSHGARGSIPIFVGLVVFIVLFGPKLLYAGFAAVVAVGAVISIPFLYLLNAVLPKKLLSGALQKHPQKSALTSHHPITHQSTQASPMFHFALLILYGLIFVVAIWFLWHGVRTRPGKSHADDGVQPDVHLERNFLRSKGRLKFRETSHPVRKMYQLWLTERDKSGLTVNHWETAREFESRVLKERTDDGQLAEGEKNAIKLREMYERVRYHDDV